MAKRRPDNQLTQNNWDDELEQDDVGQFQKADECELKNRVIRVAKRRIGRTLDETDASDTSAKPVPMFSGFSLVSNKSTVGADAAPSRPLFSFNSGFSSQAPASGPFSSSSAIATSSFSGQPKDDSSKSFDFITKLKELNEGVMSCIKGHIDNGKPCILTPIFKDYEKYVKELEDKDKGKNTVTPSPVKTNIASSSASAAPFTFSFSAAKSTTGTESTSTNATTSLLSAPTQSTSTLPTFSFGKPSTTFGSATSSFSFSSAIQAPKPTANDNKAVGGTNGNTENADDENDEPPKVEFKQVVEEESIYSKRCKVFVKDDGDYKDRGTGTLYLKKVADEKIQLIVRADTNLGNILLNILLTSGVSTKQLKNNVVLLCIPTPESDKKPKSVLVRVKTEGDASDLLKEIEKYKQ